MTIHSSVIQFLISVCIALTFATSAAYQPGTFRNITHPFAPQGIETKANASQMNSRTKRFLIYQGAGVLKMVLGFSEPFNLLDKLPYRQLAVNYGFHLQYTPPTVPVYWWTYFTNNNPAWSNSKRSRSKKSTKIRQHHYKHNPYLDHYGTFVQRRYRQPAIAYDASRHAVYKAIETIFNSKGWPGERCLLRMICEISQRPLCEDNALHGIINAIFVPSVTNIEEKFLHAKKIGLQGLQCGKIFWSCDEGIKWFQELTHII